MRKIRFSDLNEAVRSFLTEVLEGDGVVVEDEAGQARVGVIPYREATPEEKERAWRDIETIQQRVGKSMKKHGVTEEDIDRVLQEDD